MKALHAGILASALLCGAWLAGAYAEPLAADDAKKTAAPAAPAAFEQVAAIAVLSEKGQGRLQTICVDHAGQVLALVSRPASFNEPAADAASEVRVFSPAGKPAGTWKVSFQADAMNVGPDGTVFVAGAGRVARFDKNGGPLGAPVELPHIAELLKDRDGLRERAEARLKRNREENAERVAAAKKNLAERRAKIEAKKPEDRSKTELRQLEQFDAILKSYASAEDHHKNQTADDVIKAMLGRMKVVNCLAASDKDLFVVCGDAEGYGYCVWRLGRDLKDPKQIITGLVGCCGQMDLQCCGSDVIVAENTKFRVSRYDRDGKAVQHFGKRADAGGTDGFGGCCNPMNLRTCGQTGEIFTAESEGVIRRFTAAGEFLDVAAAVKLSGGCKNVAVAVAPNGQRLYLSDQKGSAVVVFARKAAAKD